MGYTEVKISGWVKGDFRFRADLHQYGLQFTLLQSPPDRGEDDSPMICLAYGEKGMKVLEAARRNVPIILDGFFRIEETESPLTGKDCRMTIMEAYDVVIPENEHMAVNEALADGWVRGITRHIEPGKGIYYTFVISADGRANIGEECVECYASSEDADCFYQEYLKNPETEFEVTGYVDTGRHPDGKEFVYLYARYFKAYIQKQK